jgi:hypothetical protein
LRVSETKKRAALEELYRRKQLKKKLVDALHGKQKEAYRLLESSEDFLAMCAGRRGGKTHLAATLIALALIDAGPKQWVLYIAPTAEVGKELIWGDLIALNTQYNLGWTPKEHPNPTITAPSGGRFRICGVDDKAQLGKIRGKSYKLVIVDEAKEIAKHLKELVTEVIEPAFMNVGGKLVVTGTPGRACTKADYWYSICHKLEFGWSAINFTIRDNTIWAKDPEAELLKIRTRRKWNPDNVIFLREYEGQWIQDESERVYAYLGPAVGQTTSRNAVPSVPANYYLPDGNPDPRWTHVLGIDMGYDPDPTAWIVLASHPKEKDVYVVHAETKQKQLPDEVAARTKQLIEKFKPSRVVGDSGGMGKSYVEEWNRRWAQVTNTHIHNAQKRNKRDNQEVMSEEYRAGRVKLCLDVASEYAAEVSNLGWKDDNREVENPNQPNHLCDAALYAFMDHRAYYNQPDPPPLSPEEQAIADRRARAKAVQVRQTKGLLR